MNSLYQIKKTYDISIHTDKAVNKILYSLLAEIPRVLRIDGDFLNLIKGIYNNLQLRSYLKVKN